MDQPLEQRTDGELVASALTGCEASFPALFRRYQAALLKVARGRLGDAGRAEDAVQETFLAAHRWLSSYDSRYAFRTWLWTILLNECRRNAKRHGRTPTVRGWTDHTTDCRDDGRTEADPASEAPTPPALILQRERSERLESSLRQLPEREADALRLRFHGELKFREIAEAMGCSLGTAKNRVRSGLVRLAGIVDAPDRSVNTESNALAESAESESRTRSET